MASSPEDILHSECITYSFNPCSLTYVVGRLFFSTDNSARTATVTVDKGSMKTHHAEPSHPSYEYVTYLSRSTDDEVKVLTE